MTLETWICIGIIIAIAVMFVTIPILTLVNQHRVMNGKGHLYKGKQREIVIVKKRVTERDYFDTGLNLNHTGPINRSTHKTMRNASVDYRVVGRKLLHTKFINKDVLRRLQVGKTYKVLIRFNYVEKIYPSVNN